MSQVAANDQEQEIIEVETPEQFHHRVQQAQAKAQRNLLKAFGLSKFGLMDDAKMKQAGTVRSKHCNMILVNKIDGETWIASCESVTRRNLVDLMDIGGAFESLKSMVLFRYQGEEQSLTWVFFRASFFNDFDRYMNLMEQASAADDYDLWHAVDEIQEHVEHVVPAWSFEPGATTVLGHLLVQLNAFRKQGIPVYCKRADCLAIPTSVKMASAWGRRFLDIEFKDLVVPYGNKLASGSLSMQIWDTGDISVADLPLAASTDAQVKTAIERNKQILKRLGADGVAHQHFSGVAYEAGMWGDTIPYHVNNRVVFDTYGCYLQSASHASSLFSVLGLSIDRGDQDQEKSVDAPTNEQLMQMVPVGLMYDLSAGRWRIARLENATDVQFRTDAFERLVLDPKRKRLIQALTLHHVGGDADIIAGKGGGSIFMLDGPPGTGKTLTAEATAEMQRRVLYKVGLGDLGTNSTDLERSLQRILSFSARWNAILLIDEADVFMEKRDSTNVQRNALVAVFLRQLEYYTGILFLTTNRGANFDPAFRSRVTLAIHYRSPDQEARTTIWTNLLGNQNIKLSGADIAELAAFEVNGREIKNAVNSARDLAAHDGVPVNVRHIAEILECQQLFDTEVGTID